MSVGSPVFRVPYSIILLPSPIRNGTTDGRSAAQFFVLANDDCTVCNGRPSVNASTVVCVPQSHVPIQYSTVQSYGNAPRPRAQRPRRQGTVYVWLAYEGMVYVQSFGGTRWNSGRVDARRHFLAAVSCGFAFVLPLTGVPFVDFLPCFVPLLRTRRAYCTAFSRSVEDFE